MTLDNKVWGLITAIICVVTLVLGWFVGVEPRLAAAGRAAVQEKTVQEQNALARADIVRMTESRERIDELRAELAELRTVIPPGVDGTGFIKTLDSLVVANGVALEEVVLETPQPYVAPVSDDPLAPFSDPLVTSENFVVVPMHVQVVGGNEQVLNFLAAFQRSPRMVLLTAVAKEQPEPGVDGYKLSLGGYIYVLRDASAQQPAPTETPAPQG